MAESDIKEDAKRTIMEFITDLRRGVFDKPAEQLELAIVEAYYSGRDADEAMHHLVTHILPYKERITGRDVAFFVEKKGDIFRGLPAARVDYFASMVSTPSSLGGMDNVDKDVIWQYFDTFIWLAEEYKKKK
jgi:hypothetical protein